ncbi:MAG: hypothetical protein ACOC3C_01525, partial [Candidatus Thorarchaeota archaeon]
LRRGVQLTATNVRGEQTENIARAHLELSRFESEPQVKQYLHPQHFSVGFVLQNDCEKKPNIILQFLLYFNIIQ